VISSAKVAEGSDGAVHEEATAVVGCVGAAIVSFSTVSANTSFNGGGIALADAAKVHVDIEARRTVGKLLLIA
jgi:hypothetical protein